MSHRVSAGVGAGSVGLLAGEGIQQATERNLVSDRTAQVAAGVAGVGGVGLGAAGAYGLAPIGPMSSVALAGFGVGSGAWFLARRRGLAPRLTADIPTQINLAGPVIAVGVFSAVGLGAMTLYRAVLAM